MIRRSPAAGRPSPSIAAELRRPSFRFFDAEARAGSARSRSWARRPIVVRMVEPAGVGVDSPGVEKGAVASPRRDGGGFGALLSEPFVKSPDERHCIHLPLQHLALVKCDARTGPGVCVRIAGLCKWQIGSVA